MHYPDKKEFISLAKKGNVIPVYRELLADLDTPISAFLKIDQGEYSYLLESVEGGENMARYSFLGNSPSLIITSGEGKITFDRGDNVSTVHTDDPIEEVRKYMSEFIFVPVKGLPRFSGGLVGYLGYDMVRFIEDLPDANPDTVGMPEMMLMLTDTMLIFDHVDHKIKIVSNCFIGKNDVSDVYEKACRKIDHIAEKLRTPAGFTDKTSSEVSLEGYTSNFTEKDFCKAVEKAKEYISSGDIIQVVLSQRIRRNTSAEPFLIYRALRSVNPSPYMYYVKAGDKRIIGTSPEILVRCEEGTVTSRPIAGTRRRSEDLGRDAELEKELLADPKEIAEHIMLVDLGRNDIGRVCEYSSVQTCDLMSVERYSHVMHMVSGVTGKLREDKDVFDLLRATFPAGTVTGAPKVRAMQIIDELENLRRGPYAGCLGYISFSGNMDMCITIRTIVMSGQEVNIQAGAGIVLDSVPNLEYKETLNKAMAMMKAVETAEGGMPW
ncbi:MAG: anthranilate synthase component I [Candidatus Omnitrophota bacterium]